MREFKTCPICSKEFEKPYHKSVKNWEKMIYCSMKCFGKSKSKQVITNCAYCSKVLSIKKSVNKKTKRKYCSSKCYHLFRAEYLPKEEQPRYGQGLTVEERGNRKKARSILNHYLRDNKVQRPSCEVCGSEKAEAHHDDYNKPLDVRWLCFKHHREAHKVNPELLTPAKGAVANTMNTDPNQQQQEPTNEQANAQESASQDQAMEATQDSEEGGAEG